MDSDTRLGPAAVREYFIHFYTIFVVVFFLVFTRNESIDRENRARAVRYEGGRWGGDVRTSVTAAATGTLTADGFPTRTRTVE